MARRLIYYLAYSGFVDAVNRTNLNARRTIILVFAFVASVRVDDIEITFRDRIGRALRQTQSAGGAFVGNLHRHFMFPPTGYKLQFIFRQLFGNIGS